MSLQAISWALDCSAAKGTDRLVLIVMAHHADDLGYAALSKGTLADETLMHEDTIRRAQQALTGLGEIEHHSVPPFPDWYTGIPTNRRPRLYSLVGFLGSQYAAPVRARRGVAQGSRRGRAGVVGTPPDLPVRDANLEPRKENCLRSASENDKPPDPTCIRCQGSGLLYGTEQARRCSCTWVVHPAVLLAGQRSESHG